MTIRKPIALFLACCLVLLSWICVSLAETEPMTLTLTPDREAYRHGDEISVNYEIKGGSRSYPKVEYQWVLSIEDREIKGDGSKTSTGSVSATGTVGLSRNLTPTLNLPGKLIIIAAMYAGRVGPISLFIALNKKSKTVNIVKEPSEQISVG